MEAENRTPWIWCARSNAVVNELCPSCGARFEDGGCQRPGPQIIPERRLFAAVMTEARRFEADLRSLAES